MRNKTLPNGWFIKLCISSTYAAEKRRRFDEQREQAGRGADLEALRVIRHYLIFEARTRGYAYDQLKAAIDDYAGEITGDRRALHAKPASIGR
jgi:hypothetical protein